MQLQYNIQPRKIGLILLILALYLALQSIFTEYLVTEVIAVNTDHIFVDILDLFSVNLESSIPTWYATLLLFIASALLFMITTAKYRAGDTARRYWLGLALVFLYLSMDEGAVIHEILADPLQKTFNTSGYLYFAWQIVALPLVIIFALLYLRFLFRLPAHVRNAFIVAGVVFVGGGMGVEAISANEWQPDSAPTMTYLAIATVEESFEMFGVIIFIYSLLVYINEMRYRYSFVPATEPSEAVEPVTAPGRSWRRIAIVLTVLLVVLNVLFFYVAAQTEFSRNVIEPDHLAIYNGLVETFSGEDVLSLHMSSAFSMTDPATHQLVRPLLADYANVTIIVLPDSETSIMLASDEMTFEQDTIIEEMHRNGETSFIIFDPVTVRAIVEAMQSAQ